MHELSGNSGDPCEFEIAPERKPVTKGSQKAKDEMVRGAIVGVVDVVDCVDEHKSKWFGGPYGYVLKNPRPLSTPIPCKGMLGFWQVPPKIEKEIKRQLKGKL
jgi:hypothetical protein